MVEVWRWYGGARSCFACIPLMFRSYSACTFLVCACEPPSSFSGFPEPVSGSDRTLMAVISGCIRLWAQEKKIKIPVDNIVTGYTIITIEDEHWQEQRGSDSAFIGHRQ